MSRNNGTTYEFGDFRLYVDNQVLTREGIPVPLTPKVFDLLVFLIENRGRLVGKRELLDALWKDSFVEEANLNVNISALRRALGEKPNDPRFIETVPRRGYRFVADVREESDENRETQQPAVEPIHEATIHEATTLPFDGTARTCPNCKAVYFDRSLIYCLSDGGLLESLTFEPEKPERRLSRLSLVGLVFAVLVAFSIGGFALWRYLNAYNSTAISEVRSLGVLPFRPLPGGQAEPSLQLGMADALITKLGSAGPLIVRPTSTIEKYAAATDPIEAGRELQVDAVLDGKIQRADNKVRVTVQLLRVSDGTTLWAGSFDDFFTNIFAVQDSISEKMAASLRLKLDRNEERQFAKRYTENTEAYELYLQGALHHRKGTPDEVSESLKYYRRAIELDPNYVLAYAAMARAYVDLNAYNVEKEKNGELARAMAEKALSLDADSAEANAAVAAVYHGIDLDLAKSDKYLIRALEISPHFAGALAEHAGNLSDLGQADAAIETIELARKIDPLSTGINGTYIGILVDSRRYDAAIEVGTKLVEANPRSAYYRRELARAYAAKGLYDEAVNQYLQDVELGGMRKAPALLAFTYARAGRIDEANKILEDRIKHVGSPTDPYYGVALIYAGLSDKNNAFEWLEKAYAEKEQAIFAIKASPEWDVIHSDPRYPDLAKRLRLQ